jgi:hypothetical protein
MRAFKTVASRMVTRGGWIPDILPVGKLIAGDASRDWTNNAPTDVGRLQAGLLMGKISTVVNSLGTVGYYAPSILGVSANAYTSGGTSITVSVASAIEIVRRVGSSGNLNFIGPPTANGTLATITQAFSAVNTSTGVITITSLGANLVAGGLVCPTDGSQVPTTFIPNGTPVMVVDFDGTNITAQEFGELPIDGIVDPTQLLPVWPTDTSIQNYIKQNLSTLNGGKFIFSDGY